MDNIANGISNADFPVHLSFFVMNAKITLEMTLFCILFHSIMIPNDSGEFRSLCVPQYILEGGKETKKAKTCSALKFFQSFHVAKLDTYSNWLKSINFLQVGSPIN